jgi:tripartite-type tricarboxylate transporter receptor subunit TctC
VQPNWLKTAAIMLQAALLSTGIVLAATAGVSAQDYPARDIHLINGYSPGAGADIVSRLIGRHIEEKLGRPVIVENRPGAFTNLAAAAVARARPDGYTLMFAGHTAIATNVHLFKTLPFDPVKDFVAVAPGGRIGFAFAVGPQSPVTTIAELTTYLKQKGEKATYAYPNTFALAATELYKKLTGVTALAVPYKNSGDALNDLARGEIDLLVYDFGSLTEQEKGGRLRVLAVTTAERSTIRTDVPGMRESGLPDYDLGAWFGVWAPAGTPADVVALLSRTVNEIWNKDETRRLLAVQTVEPFVATPDEFARFVSNETVKWGKVIDIAKIEKQ